MPDSQPYILGATTWSTVQQTPYEVAVLPWGATEAHNFHLPYATDVMQAEHVSAESARRAWERGARVVVLPPIPFGVQTGQLDIPFCINLNPTTQLAVLRDVVASVRPYVRKLLVVNAHGGNDFKWMIRELQPSAGVFLCALNWWSCLDARPFFDEPGDHAGELETAVMMHLVPDLVRPLADAGPGRTRPATVQGIRAGWAWAPRRWTQVTADTGVGDPKAATAEKGARFHDAVCDRVAGFLVELAAMDPDRLYG